MSVAFGAASAWHDGATGLTADKVLTLPAHATGNLILILASWKTYTITCSITGGSGAYNEITQFADGAVASGNGSGSMKVGAWWRVATSGAESNPTLDFSSTTTLVGQACVLVFTQTLGLWATPTFVTAAWPSSAGPSQVNASSTTTVPSGGAVVALAGISDDGTFNASAVRIETSTGAGITWNGSVVKTPGTDASTTTGNDMSCSGAYRLVTTGAAGITLAQTMTLAAAETGALLWVVIDDEAPAPANPPFRSGYPQLLAH